MSKESGYPFQICLNVPPVERGWFPYMVGDACSLHSLLFAVQALGASNQDAGMSCQARYHYAHALQLLQARLYDFDQTLAISDATLMVIMILAKVAEHMNDMATASNHIAGLEKIVYLRSGLRALNTHTNMQMKVCR